ncbi:phage/plasmid primase, P4 family [Mesorhizobium sp. CA13]|uniref:DNA primase family protein n=1 Tax=Mesorhizobium sp. CA13 TaxID=2876643 RepID=UPI001CC97672|nr:DNA primase family protein [Mesorhizobium sp. CA13]MBZ9852812.1 phage/plasmid primase, P4 family [Mesorhizobium sp. CA13]
MGKKKTGMPDEVATILEEATRQAEAAGLPRTPLDLDAGVAELDDGEPGTGPRRGSKVDLEVVKACAGLDHSDTDNAERLLAHFGEDLLVRAQSKARKAAYAVWTGTHWDIDTGEPRALAVAQNVGGRIALEVEYIDFTPAEKQAIERGLEAMKKPEEERSPGEKKVAKLAERANANLAARLSRRMNHAVSSKNKGRLEAMLACAAPHIQRGPDEFNADPLKVALANHTLCFRRVLKRVRNPAFDDPDDSREDVPEFIQAADAELKVVNGHRRQDMITQRVPVDYDPQAQCPKWDEFLRDKLPIDDVRRMVQVASGLGLVGLTVQKLFFHYGKGANGKSVYMETLCRLLGEVAVTLPSESFIGEGKAGGAANPDMARLYGRRFLRVKELPEGEDLRENLVKDLTGGEHFTVRDLFEGYFDFKPVFIGHMSGNGYPKISGTDNGIWRRMAVVHWSKIIAEADQREFEEVVAEFVPEYPGILNWLIEGVNIFLREGLVIPDAVRLKTQEYRDEMDRTSAFCARCVVPDSTAELTAKEFYQAYVDFTIDEGGKPISLTAFGLIMKKKYDKVDGRIVIYRGVRLVDVPASKQGSLGSGSNDFEGHLR